ncbi:MAG: hypothetical protein ACPH5P_00230 [Akkermansiaceae bacterium]
MKIISDKNSQVYPGGIEVMLHRVDDQHWAVDIYNNFAEKYETSTLHNNYDEAVTQYEHCCNNYANHE